MEENHFIVTVDDEGSIRVHNIKAAQPSVGYSVRVEGEFRA